MSAEGSPYGQPRVSLWKGAVEFEDTRSRALNLNPLGDPAPSGAERFRVTQPRVSDLMRGKIEKFTIYTLVNMLVAAGLHVQIDIVELEAA